MEVQHEAPKEDDPEAKLTELPQGFAYQEEEHTSPTHARGLAPVRCPDCGLKFPLRNNSSVDLGDACSICQEMLLACFESQIRRARYAKKRLQESWRARGL